MCQGATPRSSGLESSDGIKNTRGGTARPGSVSLWTQRRQGWALVVQVSGQSVVNVVDVGGQI